MVLRIRLGKWEYSYESHRCLSASAKNREIPCPSL